MRTKKLFIREDRIPTMSKQEIYDNLCKRCFIKVMKPSKKDIKAIVLSDYNIKCDCCGRVSQIVEYVDGDY